MKTFAGKVAIVTGATSGIGRATAVAFAREGAMVVVAGRREKEGEDAVRVIREVGGEGIFIRTDVRMEADVVEMVNKSVKTFGRLDYAYNNAGAETTAPLIELREEDYNVVMDTNVKGTFFCLKYEIQQMLKGGGGAIVNASSAAGLKPVRGHSLYVASKHAVIGLTKNAALEYGKLGVRVNAVCGATIDGFMLRKYMATMGITEEQAATPIGRIGKPEDIASAVLFLCSENASYINGITLPVDGGFIL